MSAQEWLQFIHPLIVTVLIVSSMASIPTRSTGKPLAFKKALITTFCCIATGWFLAWLATQITTPAIRVNVTAVSQVILFVTLTAASIVTLIRVIQGNNLLAACLTLFKRSIPLLMKSLEFIVISITALFTLSANDKKLNSIKVDSNSSLDLEKALLDNHINLKGDYCDKDKTTWYTD